VYIFWWSALIDVNRHANFWNHQVCLQCFLQMKQGHRDTRLCPQSNAAPSQSVQAFVALWNPATTCWATLSIYLFLFAYSWSLCANMASSINKKVHNLSQCHQRRTNPEAQVICLENLARTGWHSSGDMLANRHINTQTQSCSSQYSAPLSGVEYS